MVCDIRYFYVILIFCESGGEDGSDGEDLDAANL